MVRKDELDSLEDPLRKLRIIILAIAVGALAFLAVMVWMQQGDPPDPAGPSAERPPLLSYVAAGQGLLLLLISWVVPDLVVAAQVRQIQEGTFDLSGPGVANFTGAPLQEAGDTGALYLLYQTRTFLAVMMLEGGALFASVAFRMEGQVYTIAVACLLVLVVFLRMPTRSGMEEWIEDRQKEIRNA